MADQLEFIHQNFDNSRKQYQEQSRRPQHQTQFKREPPLFPTPPNALDFYHGPYHPLQLQFHQQANFLNPHFFQFPQQHVSPQNVSPHHASPHHLSPHHVSPHHVSPHHVSPHHSSPHEQTSTDLLTLQPEPSAHCAKGNAGRREKKKKTKRVRTTFTPEQLSRLEAEFADQGYLVGEYRNYLARALHLSECQVKVWFQNRRIKKRKQEKQAKESQ